MTPDICDVCYRGANAELSGLCEHCRRSFAALDSDADVIRWAARRARRFARRRKRETAFRDAKALSDA